MLTYATAQSTSSDNLPPGSHYAKVLLVSDWIENLARVKSLLRLSHYEVTYAQTAQELNQACQDVYDFVVIDVGPEHLAYALWEIRASTQLQDTPLLVRAQRLVQAFEQSSVYAKQRTLPELDAERLAQEFALTSVFTKYRALPGTDSDLAKLVSARTQGNKTGVHHGQNAMLDSSVLP